MRQTAAARSSTSRSARAWAPLAGKIWRFGIMGYSCKPENVMLSLCALETVFADLGIKVEFGAAEAAAYHAYAALPAKVQSVRAVAA